MTNSKLFKFSKTVHPIKSYDHFCAAIRSCSSLFFRKTNDAITSGVFYYPNWCLGFMKLSTNITIIETAKKFMHSFSPLKEVDLAPLLVHKVKGLMRINAKWLSLHFKLQENYLSFSIPTEKFSQD